MEEHIKEQLEILNQQIKELTGIYHQATSKLKISDNEFWVWYTLLVMDNEYSQQDICDAWSLPKQTVNSIVMNLVKKNFATLEVVPNKHNRKIIRLTEEGKSYGETIIQHIFEAEKHTIARMSEQERQTCIFLLDKYINILKDEFNKKSLID